MNRRASPKESAMFNMTDLHYGKRTRTFNTRVFASRLTRIGGELARVRDLLRGYNLDRLYVNILGDVNDGTGIYPTQGHHQYVSDVQRQAAELADLLVPWLLEQQEIWGDVEVNCVPGNHGRAGKFAHEAASWDIVSYEYMRRDLLPHHLFVNINAGGRNPFIKKVTVRGHRYVLYHGHDIRTYASIPWYGLSTRALRWRATRSIRQFDVLTTGHFHTFGSWPINDFEILQNGTMVTHDEWALQTFGWESVNKWWLHGISDQHAVTWRYPVELA